MVKKAEKLQNTNENEMTLHVMKEEPLVIQILSVPTGKGFENFASFEDEFSWINFTWPKYLLIGKKKNSCDQIW